MSVLNAIRVFFAAFLDPTRPRSVDAYWVAYGKGAQARAAGFDEQSVEYAYGTFEWFAWQQGWERLP